jgi:coenzyme F420-reducing hydrogenase beta subunit
MVNRMINLNSTKCTGCTACEQICPQHCIEMIEDSKGFLYPEINFENCNECKLCEKICPEINQKEKNRNRSFKNYAVKHISENVRFSSSSGGFFTALYESIINTGGIVYGVRFDKKMKVVHSKADCVDDCILFRGSKYVQSDKGQTFGNVKKDLKKGLLVLFTGTPCEVSGLNSFLQKKYENLITCDIICHGVPSPGVWQDYLSYVKSNSKSNLVSFAFRNKELGWRNPAIKTKYFDNSCEILPVAENLFGYYFQRDLVFRPCCHECRYANLSRSSDITMGDFWLINKVDSNFDDDKGISQVLINTEKGSSVFQTLFESIIFEEKNVEEGLQINLRRPTPICAESELFWNKYVNEGFDSVVKRFRPRFVYTKKILKRLGLFEVLLKVKRRISSITIF